MVLFLVLLSLTYHLASGMVCDSPGDVYPHETRCGWYYYCDYEAIPHLFSCPDGRKFYHENRECSNEKCEDYVETPSAFESTEDESSKDFTEDLRNAMKKLGEEFGGYSDTEYRQVGDAEPVEKREAGDEEEDGDVEENDGESANNEGGDHEEKEENDQNDEHESDGQEESINEKEDETKPQIDTDEKNNGEQSNEEGTNNDEGESKSEEGNANVDPIVGFGPKQSFFDHFHHGFVPLTQDQKDKSSSLIYGYDEETHHDKDEHEGEELGHPITGENANISEKEIPTEDKEHEESGDPSEHGEESEHEANSDDHHESNKGEDPEDEKEKDTLVGDDNSDQIEGGDESHEEKVIQEPKQEEAVE